MMLHRPSYFGRYCISLRPKLTNRCQKLLQKVRLLNLVKRNTNRDDNQDISVYVEFEYAKKFHTDNVIFRMFWNSHNFISRHEIGQNLSYDSLVPTD